MCGPFQWPWPGPAVWMAAPWGVGMATLTQPAAPGDGGAQLGTPDPCPSGFWVGYGVGGQVRVGRGLCRGGQIRGPETGAWPPTVSRFAELGCVRTAEPDGWCAPDRALDPPG